MLRSKGCSPGAMQDHRLRNPNFCNRFNDPINRIFSVLRCFYIPHTPEPKKLRKVTFELRLSYEKLRKLEKVTNELRKSYEKLQKVTKSYERVMQHRHGQRIVFCCFFNDLLMQAISLRKQYRDTLVIVTVPRKSAEELLCRD